MKDNLWEEGEGGGASKVRNVWGKNGRRRGREEFCVSQFVTSGRCTTLIIPSFLRVHVISGRKIAPAARRLSGDRFTFVRSQWSWSWSLLRPFASGWKKDAIFETTLLRYFHRSSIDSNMPRIPWGKWLENFSYSSNEIYKYFPIGDARSISKRFC